jgi:pimeloyl-ACP methyl ester carboxylesterase
LLGDFLSSKKIMHKGHDFGFYRLDRFLRASQNEEMVDEFYDFYISVVQDYPDINVADYKRRPSIIAHSFGTYITGYAMLKYEDIRVDKVILCGSILPKDFDWATLIAREQVNFVKNEYGVNDFWAKVVQRFIPRTGDSGYSGFQIVSSTVRQKRFEYFRHSDFFRRGHFETYWLPFLSQRPSPLTILHSGNIEDTKLLEDMRRGARIVDTKCFGKLPHYEEIELSWELPFKWLEVNPDIYTFLRDREDLSCKGYLNAMPVSDEKFAEIKAGHNRDNAISAEDVLPFESDQKIKLYLMSVATDPEIQQINAGLLAEGVEKLLYGLFDKLMSYAIENKIIITEIAAVAWTLKGRKLCEMLKMNAINRDEFGNPVYWINLRSHKIPEKRRFPGLNKLLKIYERVSSQDDAPADVVDITY